MSLSDANCVAYELMPWFVVVLIDPMSFIDLEPSDRTVLRLSFFSLTPQLISMYVFLSLSLGGVHYPVCCVFTVSPAYVHSPTVDRRAVFRGFLSSSLPLSQSCVDLSLL